LAQIRLAAFLLPHICQKGITVGFTNVPPCVGFERWLLGGIFVKPLMAGIICVNGLSKFYHLSIMLNMMGIYERDRFRFGSCNVHII